MKKNLIYVIIALIVIGFLFWLIPNAVRGQQIAHIQKQLARNSAERNHCEQVQLSWHAENEALNKKLDKLLGRETSFQSGKESTPNNQTTPMQAVDSLITLTWN